MLRIFSRLRKSLIESSAIRKYLLYAIGEIVLVVLGILIALQINNWNEGQNEAKRAIRIIDEVKRNIEYNLQHTEEELETERKIVRSIDVVLENLEQTKVHSDTLGPYFRLTNFWPFFTRKSSGYATLQSQGFDLIRSDSLKEAIIDLYEITYKELDEIERTSEGFAYSSLTAVFTELFKYEKAKENDPLEELSAIPFDYNKVLESNKYIGSLRYWRTLRMWAIQIRERAILRSEELLTMIEREIGEKSSFLN